MNSVDLVCSSITDEVTNNLGSGSSRNFSEFLNSTFCFYSLCFLDLDLELFAEADTVIYGNDIVFTCTILGSEDGGDVSWTWDGSGPITETSEAGMVINYEQDHVLTIESTSSAYADGIFNCTLDGEDIVDYINITIFTPSRDTDIIATLIVTLVAPRVMSKTGA